MKKRPKRIAANKHGLLHGPTRIEIEDVTARHKKECTVCGEPPVGRRLKLVEGSARAATTSIYCSDCGCDWLSDHAGDIVRASRRLEGADVCVRLTEKQANG